MADDKFRRLIRSRVRTEMDRGSDPKYTLELIRTLIERQSQADRSSAKPVSPSKNLPATHSKGKGSGR